MPDAFIIPMGIGGGSKTKKIGTLTIERGGDSYVYITHTLDNITKMHVVYTSDLYGNSSQGITKNSRTGLGMYRYPGSSYNGGYMIFYNGEYYNNIRPNFPVFGFIIGGYYDTLLYFLNKDGLISTIILNDTNKQVTLDIYG